MKSYKNILPIFLMAITCLSLTACTDEEVADTIGTIAIVGGAVAIGANTHCEGGESQVCHSYTSYYGYVQTECHEEYDACKYLVPNHAIRPMASIADLDGSGDSAAAPQVNLAAVNPMSWGDTFQMSYAASGQFIDAMKSARAGNIDSIKALGLSAADIKQLAAGQLLGDAAIDAVAKTLNQSKQSVATMFATLRSNASVAQAAVKAALVK